MNLSETQINFYNANGEIRSIFAPHNSNYEFDWFYRQNRLVNPAEQLIGTCVFFYPNLFHASNANLSPFDRDTAIVTYNDINNSSDERDNKRSDYICSRKFDAIKIEKQELK